MQATQTWQRCGQSERLPLCAISAPAFFRISAQNTLDKTLMLTKIMSRSCCEVSIHKGFQIQFKTDLLKGKTQWKIKQHNFPGRP